MPTRRRAIEECGRRPRINLGRRSVCRALDVGAWEVNVRPETQCRQASSHDPLRIGRGQARVHLAGTPVALPAAATCRAGPTIILLNVADPLQLRGRHRIEAPQPMRGVFAVRQVVRLRPAPGSAAATHRRRLRRPRRRPGLSEGHRTASCAPSWWLRGVDGGRW